MKTQRKHGALLAAALTLSAAGGAIAMSAAERGHEREQMDLGAFSISLAVKDLAASHEFYKKLGFEQVGGNADQNWLILRNGTTNIGLFQGMFEDNIITFNPGWTNLQEDIPGFEDIRSIHQRLKDSGIEFTLEPEPGSDGPASLVFTDPDGNQILIDQHVPKGGS